MSGAVRRAADDRWSRRGVAAVLVALAVVAGVLAGSSTVAGARPMPTAAAVAAVRADEPAGTDETTTTVASADGGLGQLDGATTPSAQGAPAPPMTQRVADSLIAAFVLLVLVGGVALALWTGRRRSGSAPEG